MHASHTLNFSDSFLERRENHSPTPLYYPLLAPRLIRGCPLTSGGKCGTTELSPIIDLCVPTAVVYPRGQCASRVELPVKIGCGVVEPSPSTRDHEGATMLAVWGASQKAFQPLHPLKRWVQGHA